MNNSRVIKLAQEAVLANQELLLEELSWWHQDKGSLLSPKLVKELSKQLGELAADIELIEVTVSKQTKSSKKRTK
jgi:hypothetical protein